MRVRRQCKDNTQGPFTPNITYKTGPDLQISITYCHSQGSQLDRGTTELAAGIDGGVDNRDMINVAYNIAQIHVNDGQHAKSGLPSTY